MADREDTDQPRKRIAVATNSATTRSAGDAVNGRFDAAAIQEMEDHVLIVSSQETPLKDTTDFTYNLDAARTYAHHNRGPVSPLSPLPQYAHELAAGDGLATYRQSSYPYSSKGYYPNMSGWTSAYQDDGSVDYNLNYAPYQIINQEPSLVSGYSPYTTTRKSVYVDPEASPYSYGNLAHRPATSNDSQGFSLSSMAASLPSPSDRLHSNVNRTLTSSSSFRNDGMPGSYATSKASSAGAMPDVAYSSLQPGFESAYSTSSTLASAIAHRATAHADATYPTAATAATDQLYAAADQALRPTEDAGAAGLSYVYSDSNKLGGGGGASGGSRRDSQHSSSAGGGSGGGPGVSGSLLSNGHVYVPESHSAHHHPAAHAPHAYVVPGPGAAAAAASSSSSSSLSNSCSSSSSSQGSATTPAAAAVVVDANIGSTGVARGSGSVANISSSATASNSSGSGIISASGSSQQRLSDGHRRSAGSLRGG
ncbi:hypothetical protein F5Y10DRAFT_288885 [Nemania abortiva]|nr:hypothetical protein F5Y10DRAFT_288885 [Nemania abortiva]